MSYVAFGSTCPEGWVWDDATSSCRNPSATQCPTGFTEKIPGECWPVSPSACRDILGDFFNPAKPDRCVKQCPEGTKADSSGVCQSTTSMSWITPTTIGIGIIGVVALVAVMRS